MEQRSGVRVVLDTNQWFSTLLLRTPTAAALLHLLTRAAGAIALPEVVERELRAKLVERGSKASQAVKSGMSDIQRLLGSVREWDAPSDERFAAAIADRLEQLAGVLDRVPLRHENTLAALDRVVHGLRPTVGEKEEFRDQLVWQAVLEVARTGVAVIFEVGIITMARRRQHTPEQIIGKLREADRLLGEGADVAEVARRLELSEQTYHRWRNQFGSMKAGDARRLREIERGNARLKRIVADKELEIDALREAARGDWPARRDNAEPWRCSRPRLGLCSGGRVKSAASTLHPPPRPPQADPRPDLLATLRRFAKDHPRWGYRRRHAVLVVRGPAREPQKLQRLWREEGLHRGPVTVPRSSWALACCPESSAVRGQPLLDGGVDSGGLINAQPS
jgi:putative transposase